jgi:hypothetical protein
MAPSRAMEGVELMRIRRGVIVCGIVGAFVAHVVSAQQQNGTRDPAWDWPTYNRDLGGTRYSPLTQINTENVATLAQTWSYRLWPAPGRSVPAIDKPASSFELFQQVTPIVVNGVMYLPSGHRVVALEPETGKEIWRYELPDGLASFRGVAYWPGDGRLPPRVFFTSLRKLIALRADTGALDVAFGKAVTSISRSRPRLRLEDRQGTVVHSIRLQRHRDSHHLHGPERHTVCRRRGCDKRTGQQRVTARVRAAVRPRT